MTFRTLSSAIIVLASAIAVTTALSAQTPDLSGTYKLNRDTSQITPGTGLAQLDRGGAPNSLYVTLAANGALSVGSDHNQGAARMYMVGGESVIPAAPTGTVAVKTRWEGRTLVVESSGTGPALKETWTLAPNGQTLTIVVTLTAADGPKTTTLTYAKSTTESPCEKWPTPCRENRPAPAGRGGRG